MDKFNSLINSGKTVLVDFYAEWCGPCKTMTPILTQVKARVGEKATIIKVDVDKNQQVAAAYQVRGVPTLVLIRNGTVLWRQSGVVSANELVNLLEQQK